jgi:diguanylate cyclase (GGDEF)-like protein
VLNAASPPSDALAPAALALASARFEECLRLAAPAFHDARERDDETVAAEAALLLAQASGNLLRTQDTQRWAQEAIQSARAVAEPVIECQAWAQLAGEHARHERAGPALLALDEVLRLMPQVAGADLGHQRAIFSSLGITYHALGLNARAYDAALHALRAAERLGDTALCCSARTNLLVVGTEWCAQREVVEGHTPMVLLEDLRAQLHRLDAEVAAVATPRAVVRHHHVSAAVHACSGDWASAAERLQQIVDLQPELPPQLWGSVWTELARAQLRLGDVSAARASAARAAETIARVPGPPRTFDLRRLAAIEDVAGRHEAALALQRRFHERSQALLVSALDSRIAELSARLGEQVLQIENHELRAANAGLEASVQQASRLAVTDPLTGLFNRRELHERYKSVAASHARIVLAMIDVDHFKAVNDRHSHVVGDEVLRAVAQRLQLALRGPDLVCRYGGEEFAALLLDLEPEDAVRAVERLRQQVQDFTWEQLAPGLQLTVSCGVTVVVPREPFETAVARADGLLYASKRAGRNRVTTDVDAGVR